MSNINKVILCGRVTGEVKTKPIRDDRVSAFTLAVNRKMKDKIETLYIDIQAWGKQSDIASNYLKKGSMVAIEGRIKLDTWVDKTTNQNRSKHSILSESIVLFNPKDAEEVGQATEVPQPAAQSKPASRPVSQPVKPQPSNQGTVQFDDDLPF